MRNPNTEQFWDKKNLCEERKLSRSPIFIDKNHIVASYFDGLNGKLLNIGVGHGALENLLVKKMLGIKFFGIDISKGAINKINNIVKGKYVIANAQKIPFDDNLFDFVVELDVLEHLQREESIESLEEVRRVIKGRGIFIISVPLNESNKDKNLNRHLLAFDEHTILQLLRDSGFEILKTKKLYAFRNYYLIKSFLAKLFKIKKPNLIIVFCRKK
ncbi:MAG: class I SAM-dependent methyltransferase [Candidatus Woesebacteria bacterium]|nr:class I SAM-dependent methyltransferase [Candidatus Woesebacteria bacterium]